MPADADQRDLTTTDPDRRPRMTGSRHRGSRALLSALAGALTAAGLGGPLSGGALGAGVRVGSPSTAERRSTPPTALTLNPGAGARETGAGQPPTGAASSSSTTSTSTTPPPVSAPPPSGTSEGPTIVSHRRQRTSAGKDVAPAKSKRARRKPAKPKTKRVKTKRAKARTKRAKRIVGGANAPKGAAAIRPGRLAPPPRRVGDRAGAPSALADIEGLAASAQALAFYRIPLFLLAIYRAAAVQYGVPWQILAAINEVETDYGSDESASTAGAVGWMQFMPATWMAYGVDAVDAGYADPYNQVDAIFAAARYLRAAGAAKDLGAAIFAYNHSAEYVSSVLLRARLISAYPRPVIATLTCLSDGRLPLTGTVAWESFASAAAPSRSTATAGAMALAPAAAAAAGVGTRAARFVDLRSAPHASVVAVRSGRIVGLGHSRKLGSYVILRDAHGDVFTYAGLGSIVSTYNLPDTSRTAGGTPASAATPSGMGKVRLFAHPGNPDALAALADAAHGGSPADSRLSRAGHLRVPLRRGSFVAQGTVLGRVRVPRGAKDGHLRFAIGPAGDPGTIDPRPILASWVTLGAALHPRGAQYLQVAQGGAQWLGGALRPQGAQGGADLFEATTSSDVLVLSKRRLERDLNRILAGPRATGATSSTGAGAAPHAAAARSASSGRTAPAPASGQMSTAQWDRLIARIGALRAPAVAVEPSSSAIGDAGRLKDGW